jgi:hypothetical protein
VAAIQLTFTHKQSGDRFPVGVQFFAHVQTAPGAHQSSCTMGTGSFPGVKRPRRGADHPPSSSAEVTKVYSYTSIHPIGQFRPVTGLLYLYPYISQSPRPKKVRMSKSRLKSMIIVFYIQRELFTTGFCHPDRLSIKHFTYSYSGV